MRTRLTGPSRNFFLFALPTVCLSTLFLLLAAEILARFGSPGFPRTYEYSETRGWKTLLNLDFTRRVDSAEGGTPGPVRIRTDAKGLRITGGGTRAEHNAFRIVVVGDSITFGATIHEEYLATSILQRRLRERLGMPIEVLNLGVPGYGVHQERVMLEEVGFSLAPDLVLVVLYLGNDLQEALGLHRRLYNPQTGSTKEVPDHKIVVGRMVPIEAALVTEERILRVGVKGWLRENMHVYGLVVDRLKENEKMRAFLERAGIAAPKRRGPLPPDERVLRLWSGKGVVSLLRESPPALEKAWSMLTEQLEAMVSLCRERGIRMAVVISPYKVQVVPSALEREKEFLDLRDTDLDLERPNRRMAAWAKARGVDLVDLLPTFKSAANPETLYFRVDSHWSDLGQERAGQALADLLVDRGLVLATTL